MIVYLGQIYYKIFQKISQVFRILKKLKYNFIVHKIFYYF